MQRLHPAAALPFLCLSRLEAGALHERKRFSCMDEAKETAVSPGHLLHIGIVVILTSGVLVELHCVVVITLNRQKG